ncbi:MAG: hypothetical protein F6K54_12010 [Okeania sp. SIO3B5]|uniref:caspase, EACC1-associated type n=1 Tax=Okeania sp. SIO3B5 TaxID=2607811 RepID=UPI001400D5E9|nr:caspase family protein [Okeania sp. SIO3B5]NEO53742.1 hypothetical protein [Okeania sp. SIO3B5]
MVKVALLIGVSEYDSDESLSPLPAAEKDVEAMEQVLLNPQLGEFEQSHVKKLINPDVTLMTQTTEEIFSGRGRNDFILFYFSGHGLIDDGGSLYFATTKTSKKLLRSTAVNSNTVSQIMKDSHSQQQVIILDCCYSGAYSLNPKGPVDIENKLSSKGRAVLASSSFYGLSYSSNESELSVYTHYLVEGIESGSADKDQNGWISVDELHEYAKQKVQEETTMKMKPRIDIEEDGYKIFIAKAPVGEPKIEYRKLLSRYAEESEGKIDVVSEIILEERWIELKLTLEEAAAIRQEVLKPYQDYQQKLDRYKKIVTDVMAEENPLTPRTLKKLKDLREKWRLRHEDTALIIELRGTAKNWLGGIKFRKNVLQPTKPSRQPTHLSSTIELLFRSAFTGFEGVLLTVALASLLGTTLISAWFWLWLLIVLVALIFVQSRYQMKILILPLIASITFCLVWLIPLLRSVIENDQISSSNSFLILMVMAIFGGGFIYTLMAFWLLIAQFNR